MEVEFIDAANIALLVNVLVDTGFDRFLCLPPALIARLRLLRAKDELVILADGSSSMRPTYVATLIWHGIARFATVVEMDGEPVLGMSLLAGSRLTIDAIPGGDVTIEELP